VPTPAVRLRGCPGFAALWTSTTVSDFGTYVTTIALQVLVVRDLHASASGVGLVNTARWVPYLLFGLLAGVFVDRHRRKPMLIGTDLARALLLGAIPLLAFVGRLGIPAVAALMVPFGALSLLNDAADRSILPRIVAPAALNSANPRLQQGSSAAQATGPLVGGLLVKLLGAPLAVLVDAASYVGSALIVSTIRVTEPPATGRATRRLRTELRDGLAWVYRHPMLTPMALTTHLWFVFSSLVGTVFVVYVQRSAGVGAFGLGIVYAAAGIGGVLGTAVSGRIARVLDTGPTVILGNALSPVAFVPIVLASHGTPALVLIAFGQFVFWVGVGIGSPVEVTYQQSVTPDRLRGRMSATIRSLNWGMNAIGAPLGGVLADRVGFRPALWVGIGGLTLATVLLGLSRFRRASSSDHAAGPAPAGRMSRTDDDGSSDEERANG
jgi:predicted MFS family arabinose efflux permease